MLMLSHVSCFWCAGEFKKKDKHAKPKPSHKGTVIYRWKPFRNQVRTLWPTSNGSGSSPSYTTITDNRHWCRLSGSVQQCAHSQLAQPQGCEWGLTAQLRWARMLAFMRLRAC